MTQNSLSSTHRWPAFLAGVLTIGFACVLIVGCQGGDEKKSGNNETEVAQKNSSGDAGDESANENSPERVRVHKPPIAEAKSQDEKEKKPNRKRRRRKRTWARDIKPPPMETVTVTRPKVEPHPDAHKFSDAQLNKDNTICLMAFDSITRHAQLLYHTRSLMDAEQLERARDLVDSCDEDFDRLMQRRNDILNNATDDQDVKLMLRNLNVDVMLLCRQIRWAVVNEVLTPEQKDKYMDEVQARRDEQKKYQERQRELELERQKAAKEKQNNG